MNQPTLKESALNYVPKSAKNITELKTIPVSAPIFEEEGVSQDGEEYSYNYIEVDGERYRVPDSVRRDLKAVLEKKPTLQTFTVSKTGEGRTTKYTVIPLD